MKILVLGAAGKTGRLVVQKALERGHEVHCLVRNAGRIDSQDGLTVFEGDPKNKYDLVKAICQCNATIGVLNISGKSYFTWSRLQTSRTYL